jgi:hypothetical protein
MSERFYDEEVAPALAAIAEKCLANGMSIVATVEYGPEDRGSTIALTPRPGLAMVMLGHCAKMGENIDGYIMGLQRYCRHNGIDTSASIVMRKMGGEA